MGHTKSNKTQQDYVRNLPKVVSILGTIHEKELKILTSQ